jgi:hypothetical protein
MPILSGLVPAHGHGGVRCAARRCHCCCLPGLCHLPAKCCANKQCNNCSNASWAVRSALLGKQTDREQHRKGSSQAYNLMTPMPFMISDMIDMRLSVYVTTSFLRAWTCFATKPVRGTKMSITPRPTKQAHRISRYSRTMTAKMMKGEPQVRCINCVTSCMARHCQVGVQNTLGHLLFLPSGLRSHS